VCVCLCAWLSAAACLHYCTHPDVTWGSGRGCPLVVHYLADLQSVHGLCCYGDIMRTRNVSEYMLVLALCPVLFAYYGRPYVVMRGPLCFTTVIYYLFFRALIFEAEQRLPGCQNMVQCNFITGVRRASLSIAYILRGEICKCCPTIWRFFADFGTFKPYGRPSRGTSVPHKVKYKIFKNFRK